MFGQRDSQKTGSPGDHNLSGYVFLIHLRKRNDRLLLGNGSTLVKLLKVTPLSDSEGEDHQIDERQQPAGQDENGPDSCRESTKPPPL